MFRLFCLALVLLCAGCNDSTSSQPTGPAEKATPVAASDIELLDGIAGVWRGVEQGALMHLLHERGEVRMFIGRQEVPVSLGSVDLDNGTVNLTLPTDGSEVVWTVRRLYDKERDGFYLMLTLHDGAQETLGFVRVISDEDRRLLAQAEDANLDPAVLGALLVHGEAWENSDDATVDEAADAAGAAEAVGGEDAAADTGESAAEAASADASAAPGFDCDRPLNTAEQLVCETPELAELDRRLSKAFRNLIAFSKQPEAERAIHMRWLAETRNRCVKVRCLRKAYEDRLEVFKGAHAYSEYAE